MISYLMEQSMEKMMLDAGNKYSKVECSVLGNKCTIFDVVPKQNEFSFDEICKYTKRAKDKIRLVHCGVDRQLYQREENELRIQETIEKFSLPSRYFLFVGQSPI